MARAIWKGSISFGLVNVPVGLYSAVQSDDLHLSMLDRRDMSSVGYKRVNKSSGQEVPWEEIVRGYEYEKGEYVVLGEEELRRANVKATQTVEIVDFVSSDEISLMYYDKPYYLEPLRQGQKGYALLREALRRTGKVGIARVVMHTRQHLAALIPLGQMLVLELLRYQYELRDVSEFKLPNEDLKELDIGKRELDMAQRLVEDMVEPWKPEKYRDEYREDVLNVVQEKIDAGQTHELEVPVEGGKKRKAEVIDLMSLLKRSVEETEKQRGKGKKTAAKSKAKTSSGSKKGPRKRASGNK